MPTLGKAEMERLLAIKAPPYQEVVEAANRWMVRKGVSAHGLAQQLGMGRSTMNLFLQGRYDTHAQIRRPEFLTARIWGHITSNPVPLPKAPPERLLETKNAGAIRRAFKAGLFQRACCILYGAPSTEKTFLIKCLLAERACAGHDDALYIYASQEMRALEMLRALSAAAGTAVRSNQRYDLREALLENFRRRERLPLIIVDEAQHMLRPPFAALEELRQLRDQSRDEMADDRHDAEGCGLLLMGSHDLYLQFERNALLLKQWLSRITRKEQLTGMSADEVMEIAARELGRRAAEAAREQLLKASREVDAYATDEEGKRVAPREYYSVRNLSVAIDAAREKLRAKKEHAA